MRWPLPSCGLSVMMTKDVPLVLLGISAFWGKYLAEGDT
jgi:hypothetical protein